MPQVGAYEIGDQIGRGTYSVVRMARHRTTGAKCVAKIIAKEPSPSTASDGGPSPTSGLGEDVRREILTMRKVRHENVVGLIEILVSENNYYIILEPVMGGDLCDMLMDQYPDGLPTDIAKSLFAQLVSGLTRCHQQGVAHRDLKPENLLITPQMQLKISDFGLCRLHRTSRHAAVTHEMSKTVTGTLAYMAPEVYAPPYDAFKIDLWALGCVLYTMVSGRMPFGAAVGAQLQMRAQRGAYDPLPDFVDADAAALVAALLKLDPLQRAGLTEVARHPFLSGCSSPSPAAFRDCDDDRTMTEVASPAHNSVRTGRGAGVGGMSASASPLNTSAPALPMPPLGIRGRRGSSGEDPLSCALSSHPHDVNMQRRPSSNDASLGPSRSDDMGDLHSSLPSTVPTNFPPQQLHAFRTVDASMAENDDVDLNSTGRKSLIQRLNELNDEDDDVPLTDDEDEE